MKRLTISLTVTTLITAIGCGVVAAKSPDFSWRKHVLKGEFKHPHSKFSD